MFNRLFALDAPDPALSTRWNIYMPDSGVREIVAESVTATFNKVPAKARYSHGSNVYYPDSNDIDGLSIVFYETYDYRVSAWLSRWRNLVVDEAGNYGLPIDYKKEIIVKSLLPGSYSPCLTLRYIGCFPTDKEAFQYQREDPSGRITVSAQFSVDSLKME